MTTAEIPKGIFCFLVPLRRIKMQPTGDIGIMSTTESLSGILAAKTAQFKQKQGSLAEGIQIITPVPVPNIDTKLIIVKPISKSWEDLIKVLDNIGALDPEGLYRQCILKTLRELHKQGYSAELETAAELATKLADKQPASHYFARMISKRGGNWATKTLSKIKETWEVRKNALQVMEQLKLDEKITNYVLSLAWKFKNAIIRFLGMATEQGYGIKSPAGYFFGIIKNAQTAT